MRERLSFDDESFAIIIMNDIMIFAADQHFYDMDSSRDMK